MDDFAQMETLARLERERLEAQDALCKAAIEYCDTFGRGGCGLTLSRAAQQYARVNRARLAAVSAQA